MNRGGRPQHNYYHKFGFDKSTSERGKLIAICRNENCKKIVTNTAVQRLWQHRNRCKYNSIRQSTDDLTNDTDDDDDVSNEVEVTNTANSTVDGKTFSTVTDSTKRKLTERDKENKIENLTKESSAKKQKTALCFIDTISEEESRKANQAITFFFLSCNIDLKEVESSYFKDMLKSLRPAYVGPIYNDMSNKLLNLAYDNMIGKISNTMHGVLVMIITKNELDLKILNVILKEDGDYIFINILDLIVLDEEAVNTCIQENIQEKIQNVSLQQGFEVHGIIHNNDHALPCSISINSKEIWVFKCNFKYIETLKSGMTDTNLQEDLSQLFEEIQKDKYFDKNINIDQNNFYCSRSAFSDKLKFYLTNIETIKQAVGKKNIKLSHKYLQLLFDEEFENKIKSTLDFITKIQELKNKFSEEECNISKAVEYWFTLFNSITDDKFREQLETIFKEIMTPASLASNFVNPLYKGRQFMQMEMYGEAVINCLVDNLCEKGMVDFSHYDEETELFSKLFKKKFENAKMFWKFASTKHPKFSMFAKKLLEIPACIPTIKIGDIMPNNLSKEDSDKVIELYYTLRLNKK